MDVSSEVQLVAIKSIMPNWPGKSLIRSIDRGGILPRPTAFCFIYHRFGLIWNIVLILGSGIPVYARGWQMWPSVALTEAGSGRGGDLKTVGGPRFSFLGCTWFGSSPTYHQKVVSQGISAWKKRASQYKLLRWTASNEEQLGSPTAKVFHIG